MILYHGTSTRFLEALEREGLKDVYLTDLEDMASYFAQETAEMSGGAPVVIEIDLDNTGCLEPDMSMYREPLTFVKDKHGVDSDHEWAEAVQRGQIRYPQDRQDWKASLDSVSSVICRGTISWGRVVEVRDVEMFEDM